MKVTPRKWWVTERVVGFEEPPAVGFEAMSFDAMMAAEKERGPRAYILPDCCAHARIEETWYFHLAQCFIARLVQFAADNPNYGRR